MKSIYVNSYSNKLGYYIDNATQIKWISQVMCVWGNCNIRINLFNPFPLHI